MKCTSKVEALRVRVMQATLYRDKQEVVIPEKPIMERAEPLAKDAIRDDCGAARR